MAPSFPRQRLAVVGVGSGGGPVAGCLAQAGRHEGTLCVRRPLDRLTVERPEGTVEVMLPAITDPQAASPADWVLLATKAQDTAAAGRWLERLCRPNTRVAVLQNGIDHAQRVAPFVGGAAVIPVMVYFNGERLAPDRVRMRHVADAAAPDMEV